MHRLNKWRGRDINIRVEKKLRDFSLMRREAVRALEGVWGEYDETSK